MAKSFNLPVVVFNEREMLLQYISHKYFGSAEKFQYNFFLLLLTLSLFNPCYRKEFLSQDRRRGSFLNFLAVRDLHLG